MSSQRKDMRRSDLIVPYQAPVAKESSGDIAGTMGSTLPMAAMFMRNKYVGWVSLVFAMQNWLGESSETKKTSSQPAIFSVGMSLMAVVVTYLPLFMPSAPQSGMATGTEAPSAVPLA